MTEPESLRSGGAAFFMGRGHADEAHVGFSAKDLVRLGYYLTLLRGVFD